jgi:CTP synthase
VLGLTDAGHAEYGTPAATALITPAACEVPMEGPRIRGKQKVWLQAGSVAQRVYGSEIVEEEFRCSNELNAKFQPLFEQSSLRVTGVGERGEARVVELEGARFFVATLYLPQIGAADAPHPLIDAYVRAVAARKR